MVAINNAAIYIHTDAVDQNSKLFEAEKLTIYIIFSLIIVNVKCHFDILI